MNKHIHIPIALANINGGNKFPGLTGNVSFFQKRSHTLIEINISGLPDSKTGFFAFHIHEGNFCTGTDFSDTGAHYNPKDLPHPEHPGDLPPIIRCNGGAYQVVATDRFKVADVIGRTVAIHDMPDDFTSQPSGNAGTKIACGVIMKT